MDFAFTDEQIMFKEQVIKFAKKEIVPRVQEHDLRGEFDFQSFRKLGEFGILGLHFPESIGGSDYCLLVTEPTPFGLNDLALAVEVVKLMQIPCGVVLNRAGSGNERIEEYCKSEGISVMLTIPLDTDIAKLYSRGITLAEGMPEWQERFIELFQKIEAQLSNKTPK